MDALVVVFAFFTILLFGRCLKLEGERNRLRRQLEDTLLRQRRERLQALGSEEE